MKKSQILVAGLLTSVTMACFFDASAGESNAPAAAEAKSVKIAEKDLGRLSADGVSAFDDVHLARLAIYEGRTEEATKLIDDARASLAKAKTDDAVFMKAETALNIPASKSPAHKTYSEKGTTPIAWIPIDSEIALGESYKETPEKAAALVTAKKKLGKTEHAKAIEALKLAVVDVDYTITLAPLVQSVEDLDEAGKSMVAHDYYAASQNLKRAEDGIRFDETDDVFNASSKHQK